MADNQRWIRAEDLYGVPCWGPEWIEANYPLGPNEIRAKYETRCPNCRYHILTGLPIVKTDGGKWAHAVCPSPQRPRLQLVWSADAAPQ
jgi:hypothetical protein